MRIPTPLSESGRGALGRPGPGRRVLLTAVLVGVGVAGSVGVLGAGDRAPAPRSAAESSLGPLHPTDIPAIHPDVQRWFLVHESERLTLQNSLQAALVQIRDRRPGSGGCQRLAAAVTGLRRALPTPIKALDAQIVAGLTDYAAGAAACLRGQFDVAAQRLATGTAARGRADHLVDEILEGEY